MISLNRKKKKKNGNAGKSVINLEKWLDKIVPFVESKSFDEIDLCLLIICKNYKN